MPTYDYQCQHCGHEFELFQQMSAPVKKKCSDCKSLKLKRLIGSGSAVVFKGSGFYETDYRSESYKKDAKAAKESKTSSSNTNDTKKNGDSKKESKTSSPASKKD